MNLKKVSKTELQRGDDPGASQPPLAGHGSFAAPASLDDFFRVRKVQDEESLRHFLSILLEENIARVDLPIIRLARESAAQNDAKALVAFDQLRDSLPVPHELNEASIKVGQQQLQKLAPLKGHRFLGRYRAAVESGQSCGHHAVVYGIHLFLFSIPLREGLLSYAFQTVNGFIAAAARSIRLTEEQRRALIEQVCARLAQQVEASLSVQLAQAGLRTDGVESKSKISNS